MPLENRCPAKRMFSKSLTKHFNGFGSGFTELHAERDADMLLDLAIHHNKMKHEV
jgi:hypothetical protein